MVRQALLPACQPANCPSSYSTGSAAVQVSSPRFLPACPGTPLCPIVSGVCPGTGVKVRSAPPVPAVEVRVPVGEGLPTEGLAWTVAPTCIPV